MYVLTIKAASDGLELCDTWCINYASKCGMYSDFVFIKLICTEYFLTASRNVPS